MDQQSAQQELAYVKKIIEDSRRLIIYDGKDAIVWGSLVVAGMLLMFAVIKFSLALPIWLIWVVLIGGGWLYSIYRIKTLKNKRRVSTFPGKMIKSIWFACGISMTIVGFGFTSVGVINAEAIIPIMALFMGLAYFSTAAVLDLRYYYVAGIAWWISSLIMAFWVSFYSFLLFALLMFLFHIVPGVITYLNWKSEGKPQIGE